MPDAVGVAEAGVAAVAADPVAAVELVVAALDARLVGGPLILSFAQF